MDYLRLTLALLLPWVAGYLVLFALELRFNRSKSNALKQIGYGFFLGHGALCGLILLWATVFQTLAFWPPLALISFAGLTGLVVRPGSAPPVPRVNPVQEVSRAEHFLFWALLVGIFLHLGLIAIEIYYRPVFPWDAWTTWVYRAKAWFFSGNIIALDSPGAWTDGHRTSKYNLPGAGYPPLSSVMSLWPAMALGRWSETLVNLPVLLAGIALCSAIYGSCRQAGIRAWHSALACYLLISIPLVGTHLALAGQADIWVTCYTGLGFVALLIGIYQKNRFEIGLGLAMCLIAVAAKNEALVWFCIALVTLAASYRLQYTAFSLFVAVVAVVVLTVSGTTLVDLPFLSDLGAHNYDLLDDYWINFFKSGTWHILWPLLIMTIVVALKVITGPTRIAVLCIILLPLLAQAILFTSSSQGRWAEQWTAINRLPLQLAPALIFCLVLILHHLQLSPRALAPRPTAGATRRIITLVLPLIVVGASLSAYLYTSYSSTEAKVRTFPIEGMKLLLGGKQYTEHPGTISRYTNGLALLSSGTISLDAESLQQLQIKTAGENREKAVFFWRRAQKPEQLHSVEIPTRGTFRINLGQKRAWSGKISEIGVSFFEGEGHRVEIHEVRLAPQSVKEQAFTLWSNWTTSWRWTQKSINFHPAARNPATVHAPTVVTFWILVSILVALFLLHTKQERLQYTLAPILLGWVLLDIVWTTNLASLASDTVYYYSGSDKTHLDIGGDRYVKKTVSAVASHLQGDGGDLVILGEVSKMNFEVERANYHFLPRGAYAHLFSIEDLPEGLADYILILRKPELTMGNSPAPARVLAGKLPGTMGSPEKLVFDKMGAILLRARDSD